MNTNTITAKSQRLVSSRFVTDTLLVSGGGLVGGVVATLSSESLEMGIDTLHATTSPYHISGLKDSSFGASQDNRIHTTSSAASFDEAFAQARNELGSGGIFEWRGKLYNTYLEDEWSAMSKEEQLQFAESSVANVSSYASRPEDLYANIDYTQTLTPVENDEMEGDIDSEDGVCVLGVFDAPVGEYNAQVAMLSHDDKHAFFIDLNRDGYPDFFASDVDGDEYLSPAEIVAIDDQGNPIDYSSDESMSESIVDFEDDSQYFTI